MRIGIYQILFLLGLLFLLYGDFSKISRHSLKVNFVRLKTKFFGRTSKSDPNDDSVVYQKKVILRKSTEDKKKSF